MTAATLRLALEANDRISNEVGEKKREINDHWFPLGVPTA